MEGGKRERTFFVALSLAFKSGTNGRKGRREEGRRRKRRWMHKGKGVLFVAFRKREGGRGSRRRKKKRWNVKLPFAGKKSLGGGLGCGRESPSCHRTCRLLSPSIFPRIVPKAPGVDWRRKEERVEGEGEEAFCKLFEAA